MFYGEYTHINEIIEKIYNRYRFEEIDRDIVLEAAWMGILNLGVSEFLEDFSSDVTVESYRGLMPSNIITLKGIRDKDSGVILIPSSNIFLGKDIEESPLKDKTFIAGYTVTGKDTVTEYPPGVYNTEATLEPNYAYVENIPGSIPNMANSVGYQIRGRYIFCDLFSATLEVEYKGFPVWMINTPRFLMTLRLLIFSKLYIQRNSHCSIYDR
jgi:hypothetical protein